MGLFDKKEEQEKRPVNPESMITLRLLAVGYLLYTAYSLLQLYLDGGENAPSLTKLLIAMVVFVGGSVVIGVVSYKQWKRLKQEQQEAAKASQQEEWENPEEE